MAKVKISVSVPDLLFEACKLLAEEQNRPYSNVISDAIEEYVKAQGFEIIPANLFRKGVNDASG